MDPLAQLQDIQLPEQINNYPLAIGWWILAILIILLIITITRNIIKTNNKRMKQKQAIKQLASATPSIDNAIAILKWASLQYFPREDVAKLYGESFQLFLTEQLPMKYREEFKQYSAQSLENRYKNNLDQTSIDNFHKASLLWLKHALPPMNTSAHRKSIVEVIS